MLLAATCRRLVFPASVQTCTVMLVALDMNAARHPGLLHLLFGTFGDLRSSVSVSIEYVPLLLCQEQKQQHEYVCRCSF